MPPTVSVKGKKRNTINNNFKTEIENQFLKKIVQTPKLEYIKPFKHF